MPDYLIARFHLAFLKNDTAEMERVAASSQDDPELQGRAEIIIAKQRNGPIGRVKMAFLKHCTRFESLAEGGVSSEE